jgi:WD40 repeat protein
MGGLRISDRSKYTPHESDTIIGDDFTYVAWSSNGKYALGVATNGDVWNWDLKTGDYIELQGEIETVTSAAFSPDNKLIVLTTHDGAVRIWESDTGNIKVVLQEASGNPTVAAFSPDGKWVTAPSKDHIIRIWETSEWSERVEVPDYYGKPSAGAFSPDSRFFFDHK